MTKKDPYRAPPTTEAELREAVASLTAELDALQKPVKRSRWALPFDSAGDSSFTFLFSGLLAVFAAGGLGAGHAAALVHTFELSPYAAFWAFVLNILAGVALASTYWLWSWHQVTHVPKDLPRGYAIVHLLQGEHIHYSLERLVGDKRRHIDFFRTFEGALARARGDAMKESGR